MAMSRFADQAAQSSPGRRIVLWGLVLVGLLFVPVIGLTLLQAGVFFACSTQIMAESVAPGRIAWRITRMECPNGRAAYYDVAIGAEGKTLSTALTSHGAPKPLEVVRLDEGHVGIRVSPSENAETAMVRISLRRSGSPKERIDMQSGAWRSALSAPDPR